MKKEIGLLQECKLQLEYLNEKFGETGTTNALITKIDVFMCWHKCCEKSLPIVK